MNRAMKDKAHLRKKFLKQQRAEERQQHRTVALQNQTPLEVASRSWSSPHRKTDNRHGTETQ